MPRNVWALLLGCWLVGYPIAAILFISDSAIHWSEKHPLMALGALVCWLGPLVAAFLVNRQSHKLSQ
jgi:hypothetical protein